MTLCSYKDIFGKPNTGIHSYRIFGIAAFDMLLTLLVSLLISYYLKISFVKTTFALLIIGILMHRIFCVKTSIDKLLF